MKNNAYRRFQKYIQFLIGFNLLVIIWGAFVRASRSGAGCGDHWPLCSGQVIPSFQSYHTQIEFLHRATSGISLVLVLTSVFWAFRLFPKNSFGRRAATTAGISILVEALIGAVLVLLRLVADNPSSSRAVVISLHFANTLVLLGALTLVGTSAGRQGRGWLLERSPYKKPVYLITLSLLIVGMLGAMTALGDTLFPATSLSQGVLADLNRTSHFLIKLRFLHPTVAILFGFSLIRWIFVQMGHSNREDTKRLGIVLIVCIAGGLVVGFLNIILLTPITLQMTHLAFALFIWVTLVLFLDHLLSSGSR